jgi:hypothetical protein
MWIALAVATQLVLGWKQPQQVVVEENEEVELVVEDVEWPSDEEEPQHQATNSRMDMLSADNDEDDDNDNNSSVDSDDSSDTSSDNETTLSSGSNSSSDACSNHYTDNTSSGSNDSSSDGICLESHYHLTCKETRKGFGGFHHIMVTDTVGFLHWLTKKNLCPIAYLHQEGCVPQVPEGHE